jgi:hypothetical protein
MSLVLSSLVSTIKRRPKKPKRKTMKKWMTESLSYIIEISRRKGSLMIKPQDLRIYLGINDIGSLTRFGRSLSLLETIGLAKKINRGYRIKRYGLIPKELWKNFIDICSINKRRFTCETDSTLCGLIGICPYWKALKEIDRIYNGD